MSKPTAPMAVGSSSGMGGLHVRCRHPNDDPVAVYARDENGGSGVDEAAVGHDIDTSAVDFRDTGWPQRREGRARPSEPLAVALRRRHVAEVGLHPALEYQAPAERQPRQQTE